MSLQTWKEEFYPEKPRKSMTEKQAIEHSIRKWEGLRKTNLKKHKILLYHSVHFIEDENDGMYIESESCALCKKYLHLDKYEANPCEECPLYKSLGKPCDQFKLLGEQTSPYIIWEKTGDPRPMIKALKKLLEEK